MPSCSKCGANAPAEKEIDGFIGYTFGYLCPECVKVVKNAGHWKERRRLALESRKKILLEHYPYLKIARETSNAVLLEGVIATLNVEIRLRVKERKSERYIFHIEYIGESKKIEISDFEFPPHIAECASFSSPTITVTSNKWLRIGFKHLGKLDVLSVVEQMLKYLAPPD